MLETQKYVLYRKGSMYNKGDKSKVIFARIMLLFELRIFTEILIFFNTPDITKQIELELINLNATKGYTFKIKRSYSQELAPACGALVLNVYFSALQIFSLKPTKVFQIISFVYFVKITFDIFAEHCCPEVNRALAAIN